MTGRDVFLDLYGDWPILGNGPHPWRTVKTDRAGKPIRSQDGAVDYNPELIAAAGTSWWNWRAGLSEACFLDFDFGHGGKVIDDAGIARVDEWARRLGYVLNATSRGGYGRHWHPVARSVAGHDPQGSLFQLPQGHGQSQSRLGRDHRRLRVFVHHLRKSSIFGPQK